MAVARSVVARYAYASTAELAPCTEGYGVVFDVWLASVTQDRLLERAHERDLCAGGDPCIRCVAVRCEIESRANWAGESHRRALLRRARSAHTSAPRAHGGALISVGYPTAG